MNELVVLAEGETEQTFVRDQLAAHLVVHGTTAWAVLPGKHRCHGGVKKWGVARRDIIHTLRERRYCSTMFDYYALPDDWPGREKAKKLPWYDRASHVEQEIHKDIVLAMGESFDSKFFIPYIQLHEFEALAFANVEALASVTQPLSGLTLSELIERYTEIVMVSGAGYPEAINDSYETCPSRSIKKVVTAYRKRVHGPIVTSRTGLEVLRERCDHFASWLTRLEDIGV